MRTSPATGQTEQSEGAQTTSIVSTIESRRESLLDFVVVSVACALFLAISLYQLDLPGLYTDEAYDVIPAMQMVLGHRVELQGEVLDLGGLRLPLMSSSAYQGVTFTYLALPFFAIGGVNVISLRLMTVLVGALGVVLAYFLGRAWFGRDVGRIAAVLLALSPSWIFWSRLGVYVVSVVAPIAMGALLAFTYWLRAHHRVERQKAESKVGNRGFYLGMFLLGVGLTTKLLFLWFITALILCALILWGRPLWERRAAIRYNVGGRTRVLLLGALAFCLGAFPFILYNILTRGTVNLLRQTLSGPSTTTHGVDNTAFIRNLWTEVDAFKVMLDGGYFWFQGANQQPHANPVTPAIFALSAIGLLMLVLLRRRRTADDGQRKGSKGRSNFQLPAYIMLVTALPLSLLMAAASWLGAGGAVGAVLMVSAITLAIAGAAMLTWLALRERVETERVAWMLLTTTSISGAIWWFLGGGRPEGRASNAFLGLWPVDAAGILFLATGAALMIVLGADKHPSPMQRPTVAALSLLGLIVVQSTVTVSGLWSTHLLIALPLPQLVIAAFAVEATRALGRRQKAVGSRRDSSRFTFHVSRFTEKTVKALPATLLLGAILVGDGAVDAIYHRDLAAGGGASTFSDAIYSLNTYLQTDRAGYKVVAMDWGFRRPLQFLSKERITPIEGYGLTAEPPPEFYTSLREFIQDEKTIYLFHTEMGTAYHRRDAFLKEVADAGKEAVPDATFKHRDGIPVYELYTVR